MRGHADADLHAMKNRFSRADDAAPDRTESGRAGFRASPPRERRLVGGQEAAAAPATLDRHRRGERASQMVSSWIFSHVLMKGIRWPARAVTLLRQCQQVAAGTRRRRPLIVTNHRHGRRPRA